MSWNSEFHSMELELRVETHCVSLANLNIPAKDDALQQGRSITAPVESIALTNGVRGINGFDFIAT